MARALAYLLFIRSALAERIGFDITDCHVISYFKLNLFLFEAAKCGDLNMVEFLVSKGVDIHANNDYALRCAAQNGWFDVVRYLVSQGANIRADDDCALRYAAYGEKWNIVEYLVSQGANTRAHWRVTPDDL